MVDLAAPTTQTEFGALVGISQQAVSDLIRRQVLTPGDSVGVWLHSYCAHLREQAAGRAAAGELDLATERAALARAQRERIEMQNAVTRRELAPIELLEFALARMASKIVGTLESIPITIKRRSDAITVEDLAVITEEIAKARNVASAMQLEDDDVNELEGDTERDQEGAEAS